MGVVAMAKKWYDKDDHDAGLSPEEYRLVKQWVKDGLELVGRARREGRKYVRMKPGSYRKSHPVRKDPYEHVLRKAVKGSLMRAWLDGND